MRADNPNIPYSPREISDEIKRSHDAGASIAHVHVRDPLTGDPSFKLEYFEEIRERVRSECDILLNFTTSGFNIEGDDLVRKRSAPIAIGIDLCTLDIGSMNLRDRVFLNPPEWGIGCAKAARQYDVKPEIECFEPGHINQAKKLISKDLFDPPYLFQLCMGSDGGIGASTEDFVYMTNALPKKDVIWTAMGVGRHQFPIAAVSMLNGGHVRVGFEDNIYLSKGVLASSNAELVEKAVRLSKELGRDIATPTEARKMLKLDPL